MSDPVSSPASAPALSGLAPWEASYRCVPEDFVVDELPAYAPSGKGEHLFVAFRKRSLTTPDAVRLLAQAFGADERGAGHAGMKDRHALTTQVISLPFPLARDPEPLARELAIPGIELLWATRHEAKLKPGHLAGNTFRITLRGLAPGVAATASKRLLELGREGVPNAFGAQRFGRDGDNPERALAWLAGRERGPRDKRDQRMLFSSLQSLLFNRLLERREAEGTWAQVLPGDVAKKSDSGGLFTVPLEGPELDDALDRGREGLVRPTGPMFGSKMRWAEGRPGELEREVLRSCLEDPARLEAFAHLGEGTRRPLHLPVHDLQILRAEEPSNGAEPSSPFPSLTSLGGDLSPNAFPPGGVLELSFRLPKGGYATTVLGRVFRLVDRSVWHQKAAATREGTEGAPPSP